MQYQIQNSTTVLLYFWYDMNLLLILYSTWNEGDRYYLLHHCIPAVAYLLAAAVACALCCCAAAANIDYAY